MLEGLTILNQYEANPNGSLFFLGILLAGFALIAVIMNIISKINDKVTYLIAVISFILGITLMFFNDSKETVYEVTIDENVRFIDFYNRYDIIKYRGNIFTIKEKGE